MHYRTIRNDESEPNVIGKTSFIMDYKRLPYGISSFTQLRNQNCYWADKSMFIPQIEEAGNFLYLIRPRRFGKSIFLGMLSAYYDVEGKKDFSSLFKETWIEKHPTSLQSRYQVLFFDYSLAASGTGSLDDNFNAYSGIVLDEFIKKYAKYYDEDTIAKVKSCQDAASKLNTITMSAKARKIPLYLIVDEYDNFTNNVLSEKGEKVYHALTHAQGFYRDFFKLFKGTFERILMMGVSPVTVNDLSSGYNIATNISMDPTFNMMLGFSELELREMIEYYSELGLIKLSADKLVADMKPWYDNYCFAEQSFGVDPSMFNNDMVIYYLRSIIRTGKPPVEMIDPNTMTDTGKLKKIIYLDKLKGDRHSLLREITNQGYIYAELHESFPAQDLVDPELFPSLLYYYGLLTIVGKKGRRVKLGIPNENVRRQYYAYLIEEYGKEANIKASVIGDYYDEMAFEGNLEPVFKYITQGYQNCTSIHSNIQQERNIQGFIAAYLNQANYYMVVQEMELNGGYCDMALIPDKIHYPEIEHSYLLELKSLKTSASDGDVEEAYKQAVKQLAQYANDARLPQMMNGTHIHQVAIVYRGNYLAKIKETTE